VGWVTATKEKADRLARRKAGPRTFGRGRRKGAGWHSHFRAGRSRREEAATCFTMAIRGVCGRVFASQPSASPRGREGAPIHPANWLTARLKLRVCARCGPNIGRASCKRGDYRSDRDPGGAFAGLFRAAFRLGANAFSRACLRRRLCQIEYRKNVSSFSGLRRGKLLRARGCIL